MEENRNQKSNNFRDINDDQERVFFQLSSIWDKKPIDSQKITTQLHELRLLQVILYSLITSGIIAFFILILIGINFIIIIIDVGVVALYLFYLKYLEYKFRKTLKITRKDLKYFVRLNFFLSNLLMIFYSGVICITILILIFSMIGIDPLLLFIIIGISLIFIYFESEDEDTDSSDF